MIVLDANVVSEADKPQPIAHVLKWFKRQDPLSLYLCGPVVMKQAFGAQRFLLRTGSNKYVKILEHVVAVHFKNRLLQFTGEAPMMAGKVRASRQHIGRPISIQDSMIAAICLVHGATLATRNVRDFEGLDLKLANPFEPAA